MPIARRPGLSPHTVREIMLPAAPGVSRATRREAAKALYRASNIKKIDPEANLAFLEAQRQRRLAIDRVASRLREIAAAREAAFLKTIHQP